MVNSGTDKKEKKVDTVGVIGRRKRNTIEGVIVVFWLVRSGRGEEWSTVGSVLGKRKGGVNDRDNISTFGGGN